MTSKERSNEIRIRIRMRDLIDPAVLRRAVDGLTVEISAVNGRFTLDFLQTFSSPVFVNAFLRELEENGIVYDLQDVNALELPNIQLPWTE